MCITVNMTGAAAAIACLKAEGVDTVFGYPGGAVLPLYDELYDERAIRHVLTRHEQGAVHAADGYARASGRVGVVIATSGPGATNLVTGLATAYIDSSPVVALTGQVATALIGRDSFQEADVFGLTVPVTKHNYQVRCPKDLPRVFKEAFYVARTGRPGPVLIDLPKNVQQESLDFEYPSGKPHMPGYNPRVPVSKRQVQRAAELIEGAERPVIFAGGGVIASGAHKELSRFAEAIQTPVTVSLMGLGSLPPDHDLFCGMLGMHGTYVANRAVTECDLLIGLGVRFDDRVTCKLERFAPDARVVHVDLDAAELGKNVRVDAPVHGDAREVLCELLRLVSEREPGDWLSQVKSWKNEHPLTYRSAQDDENELAPQDAVRLAASELASTDVVVTTGVGQHQMWTAQYFPFREPRRLVSSGGLGTMGYGLPSAVGAQCGRPESRVLCIDGDGSFQMTSYELATAVRHGLPVISLVLNNGHLGMVRQWQEMFYGERYSETNLRGGQPDLCKLADAYGAQGLRATTAGELREVLRLALAETGGPTVIDCRVRPTEKVFPMVTPGSGLDQILEAPGLNIQTTTYMSIQPRYRGWRTRA